MRSFRTSAFSGGQGQRDYFSMDGGVEEALHNASSRAQARAEEQARRQHGRRIQDADKCGVLHRTVIPSPVVHWVLPVRIRSKALVDVAFVGSHSVQIGEVSTDGQVVDIMRKDSFPARIRNAIVLGDPPAISKDDFSFDDDGNVKLEDVLAARHLETNSDTNKLPPQMLVLVLETCDLVFLFARQNSLGSWELDTAIYKSPFRKANLLGFHFAIDPTSRYIVASSPQEVCAVFECASRDELEIQHRESASITPIKGHHIVPFHGTLLQLAFLYSRPEDIDHIILAMIVSRRHSATEISARLTIFDWMHQGGFAAHQKHPSLPLPEEYKMPYMIIPLRFNSALCIICEDTTGVVLQPLAGTLDLQQIDNFAAKPKTKRHIGAASPLWSAWARSPAYQGYRNDTIYLAREDGVLVRLDIEPGDPIPTAQSEDDLDCNISTAFNVVPSQFGDIIIAPGDSGSGGTWNILARQDPTRASTLPNWAPVLDIATFSEKNAAANVRQPKYQASQSAPTLTSTPDVLFAASGRQCTASLTAFQYGLHARIGSEADVGQPIRRLWCSTRDSEDVTKQQMVISLPDSTMVLELSTDLSAIDNLDAMETPFDLESRTLDYREGSQTVQTTERLVTIVLGNDSAQHALFQDHRTCADHATCSDQLLVCSARVEDRWKIYAYQIGDLTIQLISDWDVDGEVTCLATHGDGLIVAGLLVDGLSQLVFFDSHGAPCQALPGTGLLARDIGHYDAVTSLEIQGQDPAQVALICGTREGWVIVFEHGQERRYRCGQTPATVFSNGNTQARLMICCDDNLLTFNQEQGATRLERIIPKDSSTPGASTTPIHSVCAVPNLGGRHWVYMASGSKFLVAELLPNTGMVPRPLSLTGTPTRVLYSSHGQCFIVAMWHGQAPPSLAFIDEKSGQDIGAYVNSGGQVQSQPYNFGDAGRRIHGLHEWRYKKDSSEFSYLLVTTDGGVCHLLSLKGRSVDGSRVEYQSRTKIRNHRKEPIHAVVSDGDGIVYCAGHTLEYQILDIREKRMRLVRSYTLPSPAIALEVVSGVLHVLTASHSLLIIDHKIAAPEQPGSITQETESMTMLRSDRKARESSHMLSIESSKTQKMTLVADIHGNLTGLRNTDKNPKEPLEELFQLQLNNPIRRLIRARCRPHWSLARPPSVLTSERDYGTIPTHLAGSSTQADIFGVSLDGTLHHFTILSQSLCRLLEFMIYKTHDAQNGTLENIQGKSNCFEYESLHRLKRMGGSFGLDLDTRETKNRFFELLDAIEEGVYTRGFRGGSDTSQRYLSLAGEILDALTDDVL